VLTRAISEITVSGILISLMPQAWAGREDDALGLLLRRLSNRDPHLLQGQGPWTGSQS